MSPAGKLNLLIATPAFGGQLTALYASSVLRLMESLQVGGHRVEVAVQWGDSLISRARQDLATRFLETPQATHLLFIDADIGFSPEQVMRLVGFDAEMASGAYPYKALDMERIRNAADPKSLKGPELWAYEVEFEDPARIQGRDGFAKALYAGMGFTLLKRSVFQKLIARHPELKYTGGFLATDPHPDSQNRYALFNEMIDPATGRYLSEARSFCKRWTDIGGEIWVDTQSRLQHVGPTVFNGDFSTQLKAPPV